MKVVQDHYTDDVGPSSWWLGRRLRSLGNVPEASFAGRVPADEWASAIERVGYLRVRKMAGGDVDDDEERLGQSGVLGALLLQGILDGLS
ncbi:hypothetical protein EFL95_16420 [Nocardioides marmorisolisilvae]|uniref:Uncharacterized protein n=1 Tax=Nocardioides marmorisolisilvae TaxID=1542737 RepID=A0A3N0DQH4_9ACTN|nr:hypothetical protein EFL95_16420 [Nocardioides marmorisolisilvae]